jgi:hypothetical protein
MPRTFGFLLLSLALWVSLPTVARAQGSRSSSTPYGVSPSMPYTGGSATYLPYGTNAGGFVPYSPGGGLGAQPRMATPRAMEVPVGMSSMGGPATGSLGAPRGSITPLAPIRRLGSGMAGGMAGGSLIPRRASGARMNAMARPPVGAYPFRQPAPLIGPSSNAPAMSM